MTELEKLWDKRNKKAMGKPIYDLWLDTYLPLLKEYKQEEILDLGCGGGCDSLYLTERGYKILACDISREALNNVKKYIPNVKTKQMNLIEDFPFENESYAVIIADLSLHYFTDKETIHIMKEIKRILKQNGILLARVHSTKNLNNETSLLEEVDKNLYRRGEELRRYFDKEDVERYFPIIGKINYQEKSLKRQDTEKEKIVFEIKCQRSVDYANKLFRSTSNHRKKINLFSRTNT